MSDVRENTWPTQRLGMRASHLVFQSEAVNHGFLTGVELRTRTNSCALYVASILLLAAIYVAYILPPSLSSYEGTLIALLVLKMICVHAEHTQLEPCVGAFECGTENSRGRGAMQTIPTTKNSNNTFATI
jgi:hypothetical protein